MHPTSGSVRAAQLAGPRPVPFAGAGRMAVGGARARARPGVLHPPCPILCKRVPAVRQDRRRAVEPEPLRVLQRRPLDQHHVGVHTRQPHGLTQPRVGFLPVGAAEKPQLLDLHVPDSAGEPCAAGQRR